MLFPLLGLVYFLAFSPQAVLSLFEFISYSSIQQCGPFNISFSGGKTPPALPLTLTVIPFNSTPLALTIPQSAWDNSTASGSYTVFLPLREGVSFIASLDDALGNSAALASDAIQIGSSNDTSCISTATNATTPSIFRLLNTTVSQCSPFSVTRNTSSPDYSISVRVFIPMGLSSWLQSTSFYSSRGVDTYTFIMSVARGFQVALLFVDGQGNRQVSELLPVAGDESTPTKCLEATSTATTSPSSLSRSAVIAIAVTSSVVVVAILVFGMLFIRRERRKLAANGGKPIDFTQNHGQLGEPGPTVSPPVPPQPSRMPPFSSITVPANPIDLPVISPRSSVFSPFIPSRLGATRSQSNISRNASIRTKSTVGSPNSRPLVDLDIAKLLEVASVKHQDSETGSRPNSSLMIPTVPPPSLSSSLRANRLSSGWRRSHRDQDIHRDQDVPLSSLGVSAAGTTVLAQDTRVTTPKTDDKSSQGASSTSSRKVPVRF